MEESAERVMLVTVRARQDSAFPDALFVSLRRYELRGSREPDDAAECGTVADASGVIERWLSDFAAGHEDQNPGGEDPKPGREHPGRENKA